MSAEEFPIETDQPPPVVMSQADWQKINEAMATYKTIEQKYMAKQQQALVVRRVFTAFIIADVVMMGALSLSFTSPERAIAWGGLAFAAQELFLALSTFIFRGLRAT